jgi:hypothetical protein
MMKKVCSFIVLGILVFLLTGCIFPEDRPFDQNPGNEYFYMDEYQFMVGDTVIYELSFPETIYLSQWFGEKEFVFEKENDYRVLNSWLKGLFQNSDLTEVYKTSVEDVYETLSLSEGATENDYNFVELEVDGDIAYINSVNFMLESGYLFYVNYLEFDVDGETFYVPEAFGAAYEIIYMPTSFDIVPGNATYNGVKLERRIVGAEFNYDYVFILPYPLVEAGYYDNTFSKLNSGSYSDFSIVNVNDLLPSTGNNYTLCALTNEEEKCLRYEELWFDFILFLEGNMFDEASVFYETYYNGVTTGDEIEFSFNGITYVIENISADKYKMIPIVEFDSE